MKPTHTHNHKGGIRTDGTCPRCNHYAETLADDLDRTGPEYEIPFTENTENTIRLLGWHGES